MLEWELLVVLNSREWLVVRKTGWYVDNLKRKDSDIFRLIVEALSWLTEYLNTNSVSLTSRIYVKNMLIYVFQRLDTRLESRLFVGKCGCRWALTLWFMITIRPWVPATSCCNYHVEQKPLAFQVHQLMVVIKEGCPNDFHTFWSANVEFFSWLFKAVVPEALLPFQQATLAHCVWQFVF